MKAIVQEQFGPPESLRLVEAEKPEIGPADILLKVRAAAVNPYDWHMLRGDPRIARLMGGVGLTKPKARVAGVDVAGGIEDVGADVHDLRPGDEVFGFARGSFAGSAAADGTHVVAKPAGLTFEQAAAMPMASVTALHAIRDRGRVEPGQRARAVVTNVLARQRITMVPTAWGREDLLAVSRMVENGTLRPVVDRTYPLGDTAATLRYVEAGHAAGKVVIAVS